MTTHRHDAPKVYFDARLRVNAAKLLPGDYWVTNGDVAMTTVLGSCVAACIRDPKLGIGGMNHFMLPEGDDSGSPVATSARYGVNAMELLLNMLHKQGASWNRLQAKVFGGGAVLSGVSTINVGERNARFVKEFLATERIPIVGEDLLGVWPRKVLFYPATGRAFVKHLKHGDRVAIRRREAEYDRELRSSAPGDIELF